MTARSSHYPSPTCTRLGCIGVLRCDYCDAPITVGTDARDRLRADVATLALATAAARRRLGRYLAGEL